MALIGSSTHRALGSAAGRANNEHILLQTHAQNLVMTDFLHIQVDDMADDTDI